MRKSLQLAATLISATALVGLAQAATPGSYVGLGLGGSVLETPRQQLFQQSPFTTSSRTMGGLGGRAFAGYNFNEFLGLEGSYARYSKSKYKGDTDVTGAHSTIDYGMSTYNLVGKAYLPLSDSGLDLYALGGAAYVKNTTQFSNGFVPLASDVTAPAAGTTTNNKFRPVYGVGVNYNVPQSSVVTGVEFSRVQGYGNVKTSSNAMPSADMLTLNVGYNFN